MLPLCLTLPARLRRALRSHFGSDASRRAGRPHQCLQPVYRPFAFSSKYLHPYRSFGLHIDIDSVIIVSEVIWIT
jgi:hypothetical protein